MSVNVITQFSALKKVVRFIAEVFKLGENEKKRVPGVKGGKISNNDFKKSNTTHTKRKS